MTTKNKITTTKLSRNTLKKLKQLKIHPRQSNDEIISRLIAKYGEGSK